MPQAKTFIRKTAWISIFPQLAVMGTLMFVFSLFIRPIYIDVILGSATYLVLSMVLERGIAHNHKKGISLTKKGNYTQAIEEYKKSYDLFCKHSWIDKYRYITLLSSSSYSYTEMALVNLAFCYLHCENVELAKQYYQKTLKLFPDNEMAINALNAIKSFESKTDNLTT